MNDQKINQEKRDNLKRCEPCRYYGKGTGCFRGESCWYQHLNSKKKLTGQENLEEDKQMNTPRREEIC